MFPQRLIIEAWSLISDPNHNIEAVMKALIHWVRHNLMVWYRGDGDFERWGLVVGRRSLGHDLGASCTYWLLWGEWVPHPLHHDDLPYHKLKAAKPASHKLQPLRPWAKVGCSSFLSLAFSVSVLKIWRQRLLELCLDIGIRPSLAVLLVKLLNSEWSFCQHCMVAALLVFIVGSVFHLWAIPMEAGNTVCLISPTKGTDVQKVNCFRARSKNVAVLGVGPWYLYFRNGALYCSQPCCTAVCLSTKLHGMICCRTQHAGVLRIGRHGSHIFHPFNLRAFPCPFFSGSIWCRFHTLGWKCLEDRDST